jgi:hypothetical protein
VKEEVLSDAFLAELTRVSGIRSRRLASTDGLGILSGCVSDSYVQFNKILTSAKKPIQCGGSYTKLNNLVAYDSLTYH